ncbi:hypothetical protein L1987_85623 [Smallanthus sonchifolius]|uniref:Uncharacterized protein n=1 Tax=Smallanthus sonchifolius TaxID=185202 RepID=A0ACB8XXV7_9ASTR|nr:hypothetical protein L1987_85623 [Smallanthus sonchifolius]
MEMDHVLTINETELWPCAIMEMDHVLIINETELWPSAIMEMDHVLIINETELWSLCHNGNGLCLLLSDIGKRWKFWLSRKAAEKTETFWKSGPSRYAKNLRGFSRGTRETSLSDCFPDAPSRYARVVGLVPREQWFEGISAQGTKLKPDALDMGN